MCICAHIHTHTHTHTHTDAQDVQAPCWVLGRVTCFLVLFNSKPTCQSLDLRQPVPQGKLCKSSLKAAELKHLLEVLGGVSKGNRSFSQER